MGQRGADGGVMSAVAARRGGLSSALENIAANGLPGTGTGWADALRQSALESFLKTGLPGSKDEAWRLTNLAPIAETPLLLSEASGQISEKQAKAAVSVWLPCRLVFVDGFFSKELSALPGSAGARIGPLSEEIRRGADALARPLKLAAESRCGLSRLSAALFRDGAYLGLEKKASLAEPLQIAFLWSGAQAPRMSHPLVIADLGPAARASIIEESAVLSGTGPTWRNRTAVLRLAEDAQLDYCQIQTGGAGRISTAGTSGKEPVSKTFSASAGARAFETTAGLLRQARGSRFHSHVLTFGGELVRNDFDGALEGEGAECVMDGLYVVHGQEHVDNHTLIRHDAPHGTSRELYKGVLDGSAQAAFRGIIEVAPQAQKTDAMVYNKNLLLSERGWVNTKPEFRIFANDVQCRHGSTIGRLSEDALFYLRSRGISEERSRAFLIRAFAQEMLDSVKPDGLRAALSRRLGGPEEDD